VSGSSGLFGFRFGSGLGFVGGIGCGAVGGFGCGAVGGFGCGAVGGVGGLGGAGAGGAAAGRAGGAGAAGTPRRIGGIGTLIAHVVDVAPSKRSRSVENSMVSVNVGCGFWRVSTTNFVGMRI
jgi:hypothetical protein